MKKLIALVLCLLALVALPAYASFTVNSAVGSMVPATSNTATISIAAGHSAVCFIEAESNGAAVPGIASGTMADSGGNSYTIGNNAAIFGSRIAAMAYSLGLASSVTSITFTPTVSSGTINYVKLVCWDISATGTIFAHSSAAVGYPGNAPSGANAVTTGSLSIGSTDGLILAGLTDDSNTGSAVGTGFTKDYDNGNQLLLGEHQAVTASTAATFTAAALNDQILIAGVALQVGGSTCTHSGYTSGGAIATPNGTSGSYVGKTGGLVTPDCSTVNYWQPTVGNFGTN